MEMLQGRVNWAPAGGMFTRGSGAAGGNTEVSHQLGKGEVIPARLVAVWFTQ